MLTHPWTSNEHSKHVSDQRKTILPMVSSKEFPAGVLSGLPVDQILEAEMRLSAVDPYRLQEAHKADIPPVQEEATSQQGQRSLLARLFTSLWPQQAVLNADWPALNEDLERLGDRRHSRDPPKKTNRNVFLDGELSLLSCQNCSLQQSLTSGFALQLTVGLHKMNLQHMCMKPATISTIASSSTSPH